jgi:hypothetical protein
MPSLALQFRAEPHHAPHATSFSTLSTTNTQTAVSPIKGTMQSTESIQTTNIEELSDFARLIASLNDERLRQYARGVKLEGTALVHFTIDRHKDLRNYVYNMSKKPLHHEFGAVLGPGVSEFRGSYSYTIIVVEQIDNPECSLNDKPLGTYNLIRSDSPLRVKVKSGKLVALVFAFTK